MYRLPTQGSWHTTLDDIEPNARPNRDPQPAPGTSSRRPRRKVAVARRSHQRLAPDSAYFYWCENCDYCNTTDEGQQARCANHQRAHEADRKARQRKRSGQRTPMGDYVITHAQLARLYVDANTLAAAARDFESAAHLGNSAAAQAALNRAIRSMAQAVTDLPRP
ncbi:hypothetical protein [Nocardioides sp. B-3]|uniref:hypothetical protein n=1 Tax=Nocardioides sp. B-3 TaxID=2895565 RepID=UPI0021523996|nr:hypothetical protein [Nocardioides sp. B-3]UUZ60571.1 hypothetical protein LP418_06800 [Nocardioides sp. B-3]